jgi:hypothetical protein
MGASRFDVFNTETGEVVNYFPFPETHPRTRSLSFARAKYLCQAYPLRSYVVRLWERGNPFPVVVFTPVSPD